MKNDNNKIKYFLYARKSTEDEERQVMSIEAQLAELHEYAKRENILITETFIESKSAKKPGREIFNEMMTKVQASKEPIGLLAWHPDRLARNSIDGGQIIYSLGYPNEEYLATDIGNKFSDLKEFNETVLFNISSIRFCFFI